ncbi:MAG: neuraminidase-like domain-containing protein, partial [Bacteroidota bacterium]
DFNAFTFVHWLRLEAYTRLRNSLPEENLTLLDFWNYTYHPDSDPALLSEKIATLTTWDQDRIAKLIAAENFNILKLEDFQNEKNLLKLQEAVEIADKVGMDINLLFEWAVPTSKFNKTRKIADGIKNAIRAKYNQTDWEQVVKPLHDQLRNNQKDALIAYLLQQKELQTWDVHDADGLFEFFLIDCQMDACMETSRIKQGISSVQLFIQRCFLGLEEKYSNITPETLDRTRWEWMQRYRVWEANRKVFLYPENWIESNLRDDKTPFFKELESELLQKDVNKQNVTDALKSYLYKVDEVANMEVVGLYIEGSKAGNGSWAEKSKLHVFSRTRNAPFFFYYRYLALDEKNWYPWEKMQVDIPCYDVEDPVTHEVKDNGCYLTPVSWNGRLLVFFPHIMKKTKPNSQSSSGSFNTLGNDSSGITKSQPVEYFEIKMGWSEYRNGKWTQKQVSKDSLYSDPLTTNQYHRIEFLKFIPKVLTTGVTIYVDDNKDVPADSGFKGKFEFDGTAFKSSDLGVSVGENIPITYFNQDSDKMYSWQLLSNGMRENKDLYFEESGSKEVIKGLPETTIFHHPHTKDLLGKINTGELEQFFSYNLSVGLDDFGPFDHDGNAATPDIYHEMKRPYSLYNWELFFHTPMMLADALTKAQQFEEAMKWFHFVFNPIASGTDDKRFWQFKPFKEINSQRILDSIFNNLKPNQADQTINEWRDKPFMPHVVARSRPVAYMKWVVMKYIDNLVAWGDYLYRQDTIETINQATQLYILAGHILGPKPMMIPKRGKIQPQTYLSLLDKWDAFGNAMVELELAAPFSNQTTLPFGIVNGKLAFANIFGLASSLYFCIPNNPKLTGYWDTIADRLYKIRHCQNIQGVFRKLPLFEPPIDPALLVKAAAQGLSIASVLNDLNTPLPNYRFYYLLQKALELCTELKTMGNALLTAIEKKDNEAIALLRSKHENALQDLIMEIRKKQLEEAQKNVESLEQNRKAPEARMKYYLQLAGEDISKVPGLEVEFSELANSIEVPVDESGLKLIKYEKEDMDKTAQAQAKQIEAALPEKLASIMHIIPSFGARFQPFGVGGSINFGGSNLGAAFQAWAKFLQLDASEINFAASNAGKKAGFLRALQDRIFQANAAGFEIKQIDKQVTASKIRIQIAEQEILNQQKVIDNAVEVEEFLKSKYTNEELYTWMRGSLKTLYYQVYSLAYELAKKAEKVFRFERGLTNSNFIQSGYWDAGRDGLLAGEQLYVGLKQLEAAYQSERGYDYEVSKNISLRQINPLALIQLRETGKCEFALPEILFDIDYPGHFKRRIKSLSVSIPCVAGPHTSINATLRLLENKFRNSSLNGKAYAENTEETDERFNTFVIPISAIATGSAQNDAGMFELNFKD